MWGVREEKVSGVTSKFWLKKLSENLTELKDALFKNDTWLCNVVLFTFSK